MTTKIHINITQGIFELEGDPAFVKSMYEEMKDDIIKIASQNSYKNKNDTPSEQVLETNSESLVSTIKYTEGGKTPKKKKRPMTKPPKGHSCSDRILTLKKNGFFKEKKTISEIVQGLAKEGWSHKANQVSAAIILMFNRSEIQRTNNGSGFLYYWDRD